MPSYGTPPPPPPPYRPPVTVAEMLARELSEYAGRLDARTPAVFKAKQSIYAAVDLLNAAAPALREASGVLPGPDYRVSAGEGRLRGWLQTGLLGLVALLLGALAAARFSY